MDRRPAAVTWPSHGRQLVVLAGLTGFAISQPLLSILGDEPTVLTFHGIEGAGLVVLAALIAFGPPLALWALTRLVGAAGGRADRVLHLVIVHALVALFAIQLAKAAGVDHALVLAGAGMAAGAAFVVGYVRTVVVSTWASYTGVLPVLAVVFFVAASPASALLGSVEEPERVAGSGEPTPVVLIVLDELPTRSLLDDDDQIDGTRFPNLAGLASDATWYRHHTTVATLTEAAVPSMLTGTVPSTDEALWTNHPDNLFTLLAPTHELEVLEQASELCPYDSCAPAAATEDGEADETVEAPIEIAGPGLGDLLDVTVDLWLDRVSLGPDEPADLDDFAEEISASEAPAEAPTDTTTSPSITVRPAPSGKGDPAAALTSARANALIQSFDADKGPALYYLHLILPHQPWVRYPDGESYDLIDPKGEALPLEDRKQIFSWSPWTSAVSEQRHLLQAQYADSILGQLLDGLRAADVYDESLVIVTSDHGVSFEPHTAGRYLEATTADAIAYAPLLIKEPRQSEGRIDDANVTILDVLPTIADRLGLDIPWDVAGAPVDSPAVAARGDQKQIYDMIGFGGTQIRGIVEFGDRATFATVGDRSIGPLPDPADPLSALHARLGLPDLVGRRLDDLVTSSGGEISLDGLESLRHPTADAPRIGVVTGRGPEAGDAARVVLAVDGIVVGGSLLSTDSDGGEGHVAVLIPQGSLDGDNEIRAALVVDGEVRELDVVSR